MIRHNCTGPDGKLTPPRIVVFDDDPASLMQFCCYCGKRIPYTIPDIKVDVSPGRIVPVPVADFETVDNDNPKLKPKE